MRAYVDLEKVLPEAQFIVLLDLITHPKSKNRVRADRLKKPYHTFYHSLKELVKKELAIRLCSGIYTYIEHYKNDLQPVRTFRVMDSLVNYIR